MAKQKSGMLGMLLAGVAAVTAAVFFSKKTNRTKAVRVAKKVIKAEKKLVKKATAPKKTVAKKGKKRSGTKKK